ncbi:uncharacterized protein TNCT_682611 [Trichonephila clavata]|uniref:Gustatory receptor n=1 Tax=Trichonephila clavata TaxID=2740835 RepID=A0A8X6GX15_TRICU|nr:uncharacterized protein TNCT_682611 [Trichonephila clavata]
MVAARKPPKMNIVLVPNSKPKLRQNPLQTACWIVSLIATVQIKISPSKTFRNNRNYAAKFLVILIRMLLSISFVISMIFIHQLIPSVAVTVTMYATNICGFVLRLVFWAKRREISSSLTQLCQISHGLNPRNVIGNKYINVFLVFFSIDMIISLSGMIYLFFNLEWEHFKSSLELPFGVSLENKNACVAFILICALLSVTCSGCTCLAGLLLCDGTYQTLSNVIRSYRVALTKKLKTHDLSAFIHTEIKALKTIVSLVENVDQALNMCALLQYCMFTSLIFVTISVAITNEKIFRTNIVIGFLVWNFVSALLLFFGITMRGSKVREEGEILKKIGLECSSEILNEKDKSFLPLYLFLGNLKDLNLRVTGGGMFVIGKSLFLTVTNSLLTYGVILYQIN